MPDAEKKSLREKLFKKQNREPMNLRKALLIALAVVFGISCIYAVGQLTNSVCSTVTLSSVLSADGQNPVGTPFSIMELFHEDVMSRAVEKLDEKMTVQELRSHLSVLDTMTTDSFAQMEKSVFDGETENTYFPTEYMVTYSVVSEQIRSEGFFASCKSRWRSIFLPSKARILGAVIQSYREYYGEKYLDYGPMFEIDWSNVDSMDYYNRYEFMEDTVQRFERFMYYKNSKQFSQDKTTAGTGYNDLLMELGQGPAKNIANYQAYVIQHGVTNDKGALLRQFAYMQTYYQEINTRKTQEHQILKNAIEMYDSSTTKVVFIPALDEDESFYMNRTKVGLDYLTEKADSAKLEADSASAAVKNYVYLQNCFGNDHIIDEDGNKILIKNTPAERAHADKLYGKLKGELQEFAQTLKQFADEGKQKSNEDLLVSKVHNSASMIGLGMSFAKRFVLLSAASFVALCAVKAVSDKKQRESAEVEQ